MKASIFVVIWGGALVLSRGVSVVSVVKLIYIYIYIVLVFLCGCFSLY